MTEFETRDTPLNFANARIAFKEAYVRLEGTAPSEAALLVLVAQSALETGEWKSMKCYSLGGIKAPDPGVDHCYYATRENLSPASAQAAILQSPGLVSKVGEKNGLWICLFKPKHPVARFRAFASAAKGAEYQLAFLRANYATAWEAAKAGNPALFAERLKTPGNRDGKAYYTGEVSEYIAGLSARWGAFALVVLGTTAKAFQKAKGLVADGIVGPKTRAALALELANFRGA